MHYVRIWADEAGESHLDDVELPVTVHDAEVGVPVLVESAPLTVDRLTFAQVRASDQRPDWHTAPRRQLVVFLTGVVTLEVSDGTVRTLAPGSTVLAEDTWGRGHVTTHAPGDQRVLVIHLDPG
ncbi:MAG: hypothetical protein IPM45_01295 [Acidimicrobiales bacterium]|nr:hypothetical protein [Acidimicrobiales bacterium]